MSLPGSPACHCLLLRTNTIRGIQPFQLPGGLTAQRHLCSDRGVGGPEHSRVQEPSGLAALLIPHSCVCSAPTIIYIEPRIPPLPLPSAGQRPAHLSGMSCDEIYINRED